MDMDTPTAEKNEPTALFVFYADGRAVLAPQATGRDLQRMVALLQQLWERVLDMPVAGEGQ